MYISKLFSKNYRSLKQAVVRFENGKNVLVGKNNSGKSNVIRALEILVGEKFPSYQRFTDNDYYTEEVLDKETGELFEKIEDNFYLEVELSGRDLDEELIGSIKKKTAFSNVKSTECLYHKEGDDIVVNFELFQHLDDLNSREEIEVLYQNRGGYDVKQDWQDNHQLLENLQGASTIKLFFCCSRTDDELRGFGLIYIEPDGKIWISNFLSKKLRDSLITTTVISALRSTRDDLRLVHYTWFGKLIENLWVKNKDNINEHSGETYEKEIKSFTTEIKYRVDEVFKANTIELRKLLERAIAHKSVSFKFLDDTKSSLYKNIRIFVNDGIDRPLDTKGTGIQSAIIIALFSQYCNEFHKKSSLLITEEPELYLHPQARRVISAELNSFLESSEAQERQLIISTHSTDYLRNVDPNRIIRIYKSKNGNHSTVKQLTEKTSKEISVNIKRSIWTANSEIFFSDKTILVEGGELYLIPSLIDYLNGSSQILDYLNFSIARVNGKGNFLPYIKMLKEFDIDWFVIGDLDCYKDTVNRITDFLELSEVTEEVNKVRSCINSNKPDEGKVLKRVNNIGENYDVQHLENALSKVLRGEIDKSDEDLVNLVNYMGSRYTKGDPLQLIEEHLGLDEFNRIQAILRKHNIFIWDKGQLEDTYTNETYTIRGSKDLKALEIAERIKNGEGLDKYLNNKDELIYLKDCIVNEHGD